MTYDFACSQVNGQDVSNSSHEDAVRCFQSAQEPIIVEVLRRQPQQQQQQHYHGHRAHCTQEEKESERREHGTSSNAWPNLVSTAVQTDWAGLIETEEEVVDEQPNDSFEDFLAHDIDFEVRKDDGRGRATTRSPFHHSRHEFGAVFAHQPKLGKVYWLKNFQKSNSP